MSWMLPSRIEAFVLIGALVPARRGAEPDPPDLPPPRGRVHHAPERCRLLIVPGTFRNVDYEKMAQARPPPTSGSRSSSPTPDLPRRRSRHARPARERRRRPAALALLHVGHGRRPEGRAAQRPQHRRRQPRHAVVDARSTSDRQGRSGLPDHARRRGRVDVQHDGDRRRAAPRRGVQRRGLAGVPRRARGHVSPPPAPCSGRRTSRRNASSPTCRCSRRCGCFTGGGAPKPPQHPLRADGGDGRASDVGLGAHRVAHRDDDGARHPGRAGRPTTEGGVPRGRAARRHGDGEIAEPGEEGEMQVRARAGVPRLPRRQPRCRRLRRRSGRRRAVVPHRRPRRRSTTPAT